MPCATRSDEAKSATELQSVREKMSQSGSTRSERNLLHESRSFMQSSRLARGTLLYLMSRGRIQLLGQVVQTLFLSTLFQRERCAECVSSEPI